MNRLSSPARIAFSEIITIANASAIEPPRLTPWSAGEQLVLDVVLGGLLDDRVALRACSGKKLSAMSMQLELAQDRRRRPA